MDHDDLRIKGKKSNLSISTYDECLMHSNISNFLI